MSTTKSFIDIWSEVLEVLRLQLSQETYELWINPLKPSKLDNSTFSIQVPNKFFADYVRSNLQRKVESLISRLTNRPINLEFIITPELIAPHPGIPQHSQTSVQIQSEKFSSPDQFNPKYTFETFVVGQSNRFAQAAAEAVSKDPGKSFNPLFIYGGVGLGKTHLMHAIGHYVLKTNPRSKVLYITSERFINEFIDSLRFDKPADFRNKYRNLDCLLIDDIQFLMGKGRSEEEFFYTFNSLFDSRKQIVISSDRPPKDISSLEERLISRFEWGVVADIAFPDLETRIAILRKKAEAESLYIPEDVILFIANQVKSNIRELEGSLIRVAAFSHLTGSPLTVDSARETIKDIISKEEILSPITIETIQQVVAEHFNLDIKDMRSKRRTDSIAFPRQLAMYLTRTLTDLSTTEIGESFGGKDHTTVMHACNKIKTKLASDPYFVALVNKISHRIKNAKVSDKL
ncbi:MAG: chromosomal replication initiator protein DnaA [bacterium]